MPRFCLSFCHDVCSVGLALTAVVPVQGGNTPGCLVARCITLSAIPCTTEAFSAAGKSRVAGLILGFPHIGWGYAPYKKPVKNGKPVARDPTTQKLYELNGTSSTPNGGKWNTSVKAYAYEKVSNQTDKGKRDSEHPMGLEVGQVFTTFLHDFHYGSEKKDLFPSGISEIPAYSVVDMHISASHTSSKGYGLKLAKVALHASSLYSYVFDGALLSIPSSPAKSEDFMRSIPEKCELAVQSFEQQTPTFFAKGVKCFTSVLEENPKFIRAFPLESGTSLFEGGCSDDVIDIPLAVAAKYVNAPVGEVEYITAFLDTASALGALSFLVTRDEYYCKRGADSSCLSQHRGVPVVDVDRMLAGLTPDAIEAAGEVDRIVLPLVVEQPLGGDMASPAFAVDLAPAMYVGDAVEDPQCIDLSISFPALARGRGYGITLMDTADGSESFVKFLYTPTAGVVASGSRLAGRSKCFKRPAAAFEDGGEEQVAKRQAVEEGGEDE